MTDLNKTSPVHAAAESASVNLVNMEGWLVAQTFSTAEDEAKAARVSVALVDCSADGKIRVEGDAAAAILELPDMEVRAGSEQSYGQVYRLRPDLFFIVTKPGVEPVVLSELSEASANAGKLVTVTDVTHGLAGLRLIGPNSQTVLERLCGLDFRSAQFPHLGAKQSSVAKTAQLIVRRDLGDLRSYALYGPRSLGRYLWNTILTSGESLGIVPAGCAALDLLPE